jgi:pimeloyl-ACP methyl ester carboxylesterase
MIGIGPEKTKEDGMLQVREIDGRPMACRVGAEGLRPDRRTLVFVHGSGGDHTHWAQQVTPLEEAFNIAAVDLPGHGGSRGPGEQEVARYAEWVKNLLDGMGIVKPVLIGHSLGAAVCLSLVIGYDDAASAVVSVGGGATMTVNPAILEGVKRDPAAVIALVVQFSIARANRERLAGPLAEGLTRCNPEVLYGDFLACDRMDLRETLALIRIPTLIVCGAVDKMTPPALSAALKDSIAGARLALIAGAGHFAMLENPEAFNRALKTFVRSL